MICIKDSFGAPKTNPDSPHLIKHSFKLLSLLDCLYTSPVCS